MANINFHGSVWHTERQRTVSARFRRIKARVAAKDRDWFRAHPHNDRFVRRYVPGEFWPDLPPAGMDVVVLVTQLQPGMRTRQVLAHVVKVPGRRMVVIDPYSGFILADVPMEGWSDA